MNETPNSAICKLFVNCNLESTFRTVVWQTDSQIIWIFVDKTTPANHEWWFFFSLQNIYFIYMTSKFQTGHADFYRISFHLFFPSLLPMKSWWQLIIKFYKNIFCNFNLIPLTMIRVYKFKILISNVNILLVCYFFFFLGNTYRYHFRRNINVNNKHQVDQTCALTSQLFDSFFLTRSKS